MTAGFDPSSSNRDFNEFDHAWSEIQDKLPQLFTSAEDNNCKAEVITGEPVQNAQKNALVWQTASKELDEVLDEASLCDSSKMVVLYRRSSWSRLNITADKFRALCILNETAPHFLKLVQGFGKRLSSNDEDFMSYYRYLTLPAGGEKAQASKPPKESLSMHGIYYNIRHFEYNSGRNPDEPWSCRQSAIHHNFYFKTGRLGLIVIQPPKRFASRWQSPQKMYTYHPMDIHIQYLSSGISNWREYLNYMSEKLDSLSMIVLVTKPYTEYGVDFSSTQKIHKLRRQLYHAQSILANTANTLKSIEAHGNKLNELGSVSAGAHGEFQLGVDNMAADLRNHINTVRRLLDFSTDIKSLYDGILKFHGQELLHHNGLKLAQIAQTDSAGNKVMVSIADETYRDSRTMRIMTIIALGYLPADVVLSFFSTTLVEFETDGKGYMLRVHREIWIALLAILVFAAGTTIIARWCGQRNKRSKLDMIS